MSHERKWKHYSQKGWVMLVEENTTSKVVSDCNNENTKPEKMSDKKKIYQMNFFYDTHRFSVIVFS